MDILELIGTVRRHIIMIVCLTFICFALSVVAAFRMQKIYESSSTLIVQQQGGLSLGSAGALLGFPSQSQQGLSPDYIKLIATSDTIARTVIERLDLGKNENFAKTGDGEEELLKAFRRNLKVDTGIMSVKVSFASPDPKLAAAAANETADQTAQYIKNSAIRDYEDYQKVLVMYQDQLMDMETKIKNYEQKHGVVQIDAQFSQAIEEAAQYQIQTFEKQSELESLSTLLDNTTDLDLWTQTRQRMEGLKNEIRILKAKTDEIDGAMNAVPEMKLEYMNMLRDQKTITLKMAAIDTQRDLSLFETERSNKKLRVLDRAYPSKWPSRPKKKLIAAIGFALGLFMSFSLSFLIELLKAAPAPETNETAGA